MFTRERMYLEHIKNIFEICMYVLFKCQIVRGGTRCIGQACIVLINVAS